MKITKKMMTNNNNLIMKMIQKDQMKTKEIT